MIFITITNLSRRREMLALKFIGAWYSWTIALVKVQNVACFSL